MITIGCDEVGLGSLAGPVVTAAVAFRKGATVVGITDSKKISDSRRRALEPRIKEEAQHWVIARSDHNRIDRYGIRRCKLACFVACIRRCVLQFRNYEIIVDGVDPIPGFDVTCMPKADLKIPAVSAASIIAKVYRDDLMIRADARHPGYGFYSNSGYPTKKHLEALREKGPCKIHRKSYGPVKRVIASMK
jgi:ribonuclease HII